MTQINKTNNHFCSSSCAAKYNNKYSKKRKLSKKCKTCSALIYKCQTYCSSCWDLLNPNIGENTLGQYKIRSDANRYRSIRDHARKVMKNNLDKCHICSYKVHVEVCHIKEINDFSNDTKIKVINDPKNLVCLCRNHHWELDHNILSVIRNGPAQN